MSKRRTAARGYGAAHQRIRKRWAPNVAAGLVDCWRCSERIAPGEQWDLGHDDHDRSRYRGPEHQACNRGATRGGQQQKPGAECSPFRPMTWPPDGIKPGELVCGATQRRCDCKWSR